MSINEQVRERVIEAIIEIHDSQKLAYKEVMTSIGGVQQEFTQFKSGKRYPTLQHIVSLNTEHKYTFDWLLTGLPPKRSIIQKSPLSRLKEIEDEIVELKKIFK